MVISLYTPSFLKEFLNAVVTDIVHFSHKRLKYSPGNYNTFLQRREERLKHQQKQIELGEKQKAKLEEQIEKFKKQVSDV